MMMFGGLLILILFGFLFLLVAVALFALLAGRKPQLRNPGASGTAEQTPLEILKARYARGEISQAEYQQMRRDLE